MLTAGGGVDVVIIMVTHYYTLFFTSYSTSLFLHKPRCFWDFGMIMKPSCHVRISFRTEMEKNSRELFQNKFDIPQIVLCWVDLILLDSEKLSALSFIEKSKKKCRVWWSMISFVVATQVIHFVGRSFMHGSMSKITCQTHSFITSFHDERR